MNSFTLLRHCGLLAGIVVLAVGAAWVAVGLADAVTWVADEGLRGIVKAIYNGR